MIMAMKIEKESNDKIPGYFKAKAALSHSKEMLAHFFWLRRRSFCCLNHDLKD